MVVDVCDQHDIFKRQCNKRIKYYNKQGYKIQRSSNKTIMSLTMILNLENLRVKEKYNYR